MQNGASILKTFSIRGIKYFERTKLDLILSNSYRRKFVGSLIPSTNFCNTVLCTEGYHTFMAGYLMVLSINRGPNLESSGVPILAPTADLVLRDYRRRALILSRFAFGLFASCKEFRLAPISAFAVRLVKSCTRHPKSTHGPQTPETHL